MHIGAISDIHGNYPALQAVLDDMPGVDTITSLGDVVGYGPHPQKTAKKIKEVTSTSLRGNHETYLKHPEYAAGNKGAHEGIKHAREQLSDDLLEWLTTRPYRDVIANDIGIAHGHPDPDTPFAYVKKRSVTDLIPVLSEQEYVLQAVGHTHVQFKQDLSKFDDDAGLVFNPGSVGQPRDKNPKAAYAVINTNKLQNELTEAVTLHRTEYPIDETVQSITTHGLPKENGARLRTGQYPRNQRNKSDWY
jgi:putative phosphoesterase